jgi:hypothetical protein
MYACRNPTSNTQPVIDNSRSSASKQPVTGLSHPPNIGGHVGRGGADLRQNALLSRIMWTPLNAAPRSSSPNPAHAQPLRLAGVADAAGPTLRDGWAYPARGERYVRRRSSPGARGDH